MNDKKIIKGKRPEFYATPGVDYLMHMVTVLAQEHSAMRDRLDTIERVAAEKGLFLDTDIEAYVPSQPVLEHREAARQQFLSNFFSVMTQQAAEVATADTKSRFNKVIDDLATEV